MRAGRVAVDGVVALEPSAAVEPGATRDARRRSPSPRDGPAGVLVALVGGERAARSPIRASCTSPARRRDGRLAALLSDERLARRLRALGYDPGRLGGAHPEEGGFRPLDAGRARRGARAGAGRPARERARA